MSSVAVQVVV